MNGHLSNRFDNYSHLDPEDRLLADLLCSGSDERSALGPDGLNKYGGAPYPRATVPFGSCTASTVSTRGWSAARGALTAYRRRAEEVGAEAAADEMGRRNQENILRLLDLADVADLRVLLTPSGSDAESIALFLASLADRRPLTNIVVGAREVGSGTVLAAGGRYFSEVTPGGRRRLPGAPIEPGLAERTTVHEVKIRVDNAAERSPEEVDADIRRIVEAAVAADARIMCHIVAHSKTGVHAPRLETMNELVARYGDRIVPVIDAAQGRFSRRGLRDYIARGFMVIITGSKFYGGPSFAGCLLIPGRAIPRDQERIRFPAGYSDFLTPAQLPAVWSAARASLDPSCNLGLLLRWEAAIAEMRAYYEAPALARYRVLRFFEAQAPIILGRSPVLELINVPLPVFDDTFERLLESKTTVFSFRVKDNLGRQVGLPRLSRWVRWLNHDVSEAVPPDAPQEVREAVRNRFQLGQAVHVGEQQSGDHDHVIRVAIGSVLIVDIATDDSLGGSLDARLQWLAAKLEQLRLKIEFIAAQEAAVLALGRQED